MAERYAIPTLKDLAKEKLNSAISTSWEMDDFPLAIAEAYTTTVEEDRGLRDLIVEICHNNIDELLIRQGFCQILRETPNFAADLVLFGCTSEIRYQCPSCRHLFRSNIAAKTTYHCPECGRGRNDWECHNNAKDTS